jgi:hypothetical protein
MALSKYEQDTRTVYENARRTWKSFTIIVVVVLLITLVIEKNSGARQLFEQRTNSNVDLITD